MAELPARIGPYRIVGVLGEGGMGTVYLAEQREPVERKVALKVAKGGLDGKQVLSRFEFERRALAAMNHSAIAKVFDAGETEEGQLYFAMEYVPGTSIVEFCDRHQLHLRDRIGLFRQVCEGVQHAHQKGVVHRDLKPANVLVADEGGRPVAKIIDFGLARATDVFSARSLLTQEGQLVGTPAYMSPEQASGRDDAIDTRTDIYALGVVLYELLTGGLPFSPSELRYLGMLEVLRVIREEEPPKPSTRVSSAGDAARGMATARRTTPTALCRKLRGDLDWVVMRAMAKEPERRYASANDLAADLARYLDGQPVTAGPPGAGYRLRKLVRRHRVPFAAAVIVLLTLVAGIVVSTHFAIEARAQAVEAERSAAGTTAIHDFLLRRLIAAATPESARGRELTARDVLEQAADEVEGAFPDQPELAGIVRSTLGDALWKTGQSDRAIEHLRWALATLTRCLGRNHRETMLAAHRLAWVLLESDGVDEAQELIAENLRVQEEALGPRHADTLKSRYALAQILAQRDQPAAAAAEFREVWVARQEVLGPYHSYTLNALRSYANGLYRSGQLQEARGLLRRLVDECDHLPPGDPMRATALNDLALVLEDLGENDEAIEAYQRCLVETEHVDGRESAAYAFTLNNYAWLLSQLGRPEEALPKFEESIRIREEVYSPEHSSVGRARSNLGQALLKAGQAERAVAELRASVRILSAATEGPSRDGVRAQAALARALDATGDAAAAEAGFQTALSGAAVAWPPEHWERAFVGTIYGDHLAHRDGRQALEQYEAAYPRFESQLGRDHERTRELVHKALEIGEQLKDEDAIARWRGLPGSTTHVFVGALCRPSKPERSPLVGRPTPSFAARMARHSPSPRRNKRMGLAARRDPAALQPRPEAARRLQLGWGYAFLCSAETAAVLGVGSEAHPLDLPCRRTEDRPNAHTKSLVGVVHTVFGGSRTVWRLPGESRRLPWGIGRLRHHGVHSAFHTPWRLHGYSAELCGEHRLPVQLRRHRDAHRTRGLRSVASRSVLCRRRLHAPDSADPTHRAADPERPGLPAGLLADAQLHLLHQASAWCVQAPRKGHSRLQEVPVAQSLGRRTALVFGGGATIVGLIVWLMIHTTAEGSAAPGNVASSPDHQQMLAVPARHSSDVSSERRLVARSEETPPSGENTSSLTELGRALAANPGGDVGLINARVLIHMFSDEASRAKFAYSSNMGPTTLDDVIKDPALNPHGKKLTPQDRGHLEALVSEFQSMSRELHLDRQLVLNQIVEKAILAGSYSKIPKGEGADAAVEAFDRQYGDISQDFTWTSVPGADDTYTRRIPLFRAEHPVWFEMNDDSHRVARDLHAALQAFFENL